MMTEQRNTSTARWKLTVSWLVLVLFIAGVEYWLGWKTVLEPWMSFSWTQGVIALALLVVSYALRAWRMYDYFPQQLGGQWLQTWRLMLIHNALNNVLPARTGELSFPVMMKRYFGVGYAHSVSALAWFRFLDLHAILAFAIFPLLVVTPLKRVAVPLMVLWLLLPIVVYLLRNRIEVAFAGKDGMFSQLAQQAMYGLPDSWGEFWRSWVMTWANWGVKLITLAWLLGQFLPTLSWNMLLTGVVGGELTSVLPIHAPGGFGTYEAGVIAALSPVMSMQAATVGAVNVHLFVLGSSLVGALVGWLIPLKVKNA
ncbi:MAG: flippase-like domain-containing protein [Candidatus Thiothrix sulfatifontis]|nr:MAG: flippase-like domain-containing protein [Candidatus Thiothrix sulfatifontis]